MIPEAEVKCVVQAGKRRGKLLAWGQSGRAAWRSPCRVKLEKSKKDKGQKWVDPEEGGAVQGAAERGSSWSQQQAEWVGWKCVVPNLTSPEVV